MLCAIIETYIQSDAEMKKWNNNIRGILHEGRILAKGYIMDMMEEEWQRIDGGERLNEIKKPEFLEILKR